MDRIVCTVLVCLACAVPAAAQQDEPIGRYIFDVRGAYSRNKVEPDIAQELGVAAGNLPSRGWGLAGGGHLYVWHTKHITLGAGAETVWARGSRTTQITNADGSMSDGATVRRHFFTVV